MKITRGWTVRGVVPRCGHGCGGRRREKVRPSVFAAPLIVPDSKRWATTDRLGQFELVGVMPGSDEEVRIEHPRYRDKEVPFPQKPEDAETDVHGRSQAQSGGGRSGLGAGERLGGHTAPGRGSD